MFIKVCEHFTDEFEKANTKAQTLLRKRNLDTSETETDSRKKVVVLTSQPGSSFTPETNLFLGKFLEYAQFKRQNSTAVPENLIFLKVH